MPKGGPKTFWNAPEAQLLKAVKDEYSATGYIAWSPRHYNYRLLELGLLRKEDAYCTSEQSQKNAFQWNERKMVDWRESGALPWEAIAEEDRETSSYLSHNSLRSHVAELGDDYYIANHWRGQETQLLVAVEKQGLYAAVDRVCRPYGVEVCFTKGQDSAGHVHELAHMLRRRLNEEGRVTELLYVGDLDPYGVLIEHSLYERLNRYGY